MQSVNRELRQGGSDLIDEQTARSYIGGFYQRFPKVKDFFDREWEKLKKLPVQGRVLHSPMGRDLRFSRTTTAEMERQFRVTWTQQMEADLIKTAMLRLDRIFRRRNMKARIVSMIHDSLGVEAPQEEESEARYLMRRTMTAARRLCVRLEVDID